MTTVLERPLTSALDQPQPDDGCQAAKGLCGKHPVVAVIYWQPGCDCGINPQRICREHLDLFIRGLAEGGGDFECDWCGAELIFVKVVTL